MVGAAWASTDQSGRAQQWTPDVHPRAPRWPTAAPRAQAASGRDHGPTRPSDDNESRGSSRNTTMPARGAARRAAPTTAVRAASTARVARARPSWSGTPVSASAHPTVTGPATCSLRAGGGSAATRSKKAWAAPQAPVGRTEGVVSSASQGRTWSSIPSPMAGSWGQAGSSGWASSTRRAAASGSSWGRPPIPTGSPGRRGAVTPSATTGSAGHRRAEHGVVAVYGDGLAGGHPPDGAGQIDPARPDGAFNRGPVSRGLHAHRRAGVERAVDPGEGPHRNGGHHQLGEVPDGDGGGRHVYGDRVAPAAVAGRSHAPALADGHQLHGVDCADLLARPGVDQAAGLQRGPGADEAGPPVGAADEADVLAVGLHRGGQAELGGPPADLSLGHLPHRQQDVGQLGLAEHGQDVGLVLVGVATPQQGPAPVALLHPGVVAGRHRVEPELAGPVEEAVELQVAVALDARVGCAPGEVLVHVGRHDPGFEVVGEVEDVVLDAELTGDPAGVLHVGHRAAPGVAVAPPQLHGRPHHLVAGTDQLGGGDRGVDTTRHGDEHLHGATVAVWRSRATTLGTSARARSTSAPVLHQPRDRRRAERASSGGMPMANSTWLGSSAPLAHADPAEAATPASSRRKRSASLSTPGMRRWQLPAPLSARAPVSTAPGTPATSPSASRSRSRPTRATVSDRWATVAVAAAAMPTMPATLWVPLRRPRSWPPPWMTGASRAPPRTTRAPTPWGPPNLWALTVTRSAPAARAATSSHGKACTASVWTRAPGARRRTTSTTWSSGWMTPTSLLASITDTTSTVLTRVPSNRSRSTRPPASTSTKRPPVDRQHSSTASCSMVEQTMVPPAAAPSRARLSASVPPAVNTMSPGSAPRAWAICWRASSTAWRARRASEWLPDGLPKRSPSQGSIASRASGRSGVVAAWSRYAGIHPRA